MSRTYKVSTFKQAEDQINRVHNSINAIRSQVAEAERRARNAAREEANRRARELRQEISDLEYSLNSQLANVSDEVRRNYIEHKKALASQANHFNQQFSNLHNWTQASLNQLSSEMNKRFEEHQTQIDSNRLAIQNIYEREKNLVIQAQQRLNDLQGLLNAFDANNNHDKYVSGRYSQLKRRLQGISGSDVPSQSVIAEAISITNDIFDLEEEIAKKKMVFESIHNQTLGIAEELLLEINNNRTNLFFTDENGQELEDEDGKKLQVEVDFWTEDEYTILETEANKIKVELETKKESPELDIEELKIFQGQLAQLKDQQEKLVLLACEKGLLSMDRDDIANDILEAFENQGFWLKEENAIFYEGNEEKKTVDDQRESIAINVINNIGTELTIRIVPEGMQNKIHFHRNDNRDMTQQEYMKLLEEVQKVIEGAGNGYKMGELKAPDVGDVRIGELADMNALRRGLKKETKNIK